MKDPYAALKKARERREAKSQHPQPVLIPTEPKKISLLAKLKLANQARKVLSQAKSTNYTMAKSWKTTVFGASGLGTAIWNIASMLLDGDPATNPDWAVYLPVILASAAAIFARDNDKSSQDVGLRK
jgi:hypothetical protein